MIHDSMLVDNRMSVGWRQHGLSLIELMVGMTIGLVLTIGLFAMISNTSQTFKVQDDFARMQENATTAMRYIGDSLRSAGFYGYSRSTGTMSNPVPVIMTTDCGPSGLALDFANPLAAQGGLMPATVAGSFSCIVPANFYQTPVANSNPVLVTRSAGGYAIPDTPPLGDLTADLAAQTNSATTIYLQSDPNVGLLFYGANFPALKVAGTARSSNTGADLDIFEYRAHVYYIRPCSRPAAGGVCAASDDSGQPIPTLVRQELVGSVMTEVALAEGIERISYQFGIDDTPAAPLGFAGRTGDGVPDRFTSTPAPADWANVVAVRVAMLVRAPTLNSTYNDSGKSYDLDGDNTADFTCTAGVNCMYKRKVFSQLFQLRNLAQRRGG